MICLSPSLPRTVFRSLRRVLVPLGFHITSPFSQHRFFPPVERIHPPFRTPHRQIVYSRDLGSYTSSLRRRSSRAPARTHAHGLNRALGNTMPGRGRNSSPPPPSSSSPAPSAVAVACADAGPVPVGFCLGIGVVAFGWLPLSMRWTAGAYDGWFGFGVQVRTALFPLLPKRITQRRGPS